ncbi:hypothetical protein NZ698_10965 [Chryseobacterium sp. PBS4-4]|uniref:Uncharacterized protein n=1 Tax=Chryseobacterium edaphi TaxID=2976532 RepID=A0ABT2W8I8_9FLAO|nr:hypothetical protein [Chryseobacterium edaphi]MCU7617719.1 hypothetical protein [Chryseobacterium edaphi]
MSNIGKIIRVNALPSVGERENNVIYQVAAPGAATYTDYAIDENGDIKTHSGNFNPQDLVDSAVNISNQELLDEGISTQKDFNAATRERLIHKLDKPYMDGNPLEYPKVLGLDNNGNTATLPVGDLGKNIANSSLTSVAGSGLTLGSDWGVETAGHPYSISGLSDVSTNPAFHTFLSQDDSGKLGRTSGVQPFLSLPSTLSESEKAAWKTAMNGGWTTNTMSVAMVSPLVIDRTSNINTWVSLKGANLNLNPASFSVEIMNEDGDTAVDQILSSQVQLYQNGIDLVFYYNFSNLPVGKYRIRVWNGVAYYITNSNLSINSVNSVSNIDTSTLTWEVRSVPENNNTYTVGNGNIAKIMDETSQSSGSNYPVVSIKSSPFHDITDNFYIEMNVNYTIGTLVGNTLFELLPARIGLTYSDFNINSDVFNTVAYLAYKPFSGRGEANINTISPPFVAIASSDGVSSYSQKLTFIKNGNILYLIWSFNNQIYQIDIDNTRALSIIMQLPNWQYGLSNMADLTISKAYKF